MAQALIAFLQQQYVERDGVEQPFFAGCFGIFGHGNVAGIGQALQQTPEFRYYQSRNEQAMVHTAIGYAKMKNRLQTFACTSSIGPGATNMITGAATATINRLPVLLLPGDIFARRNVAPVLQQLESEHSAGHLGQRLLQAGQPLLGPHQPPRAAAHRLPEAMRVLTSPAETGAVTLALPQDVQTEAFDYPEAFFSKRVWHVAAQPARPRRARSARPQLDPRQPAAADRRRRRRALQRGHRGAAPVRRAARAFPWARRWPARAACATTTR